jgi:hypothetical protein
MPNTLFISTQHTARRPLVKLDELAGARVWSGPATPLREESMKKLANFDW